MKKQILLIAAMATTLYVCAQKQNQVYLDYISQWQSVAIQNQADYGVPASIIMAQALLESGAGQSELAKNANNHFGIKCTSDWFGGVYYYDDERKGDCFRKYKNAAESFKDHAVFLQRPRYSTCFEIAIEDYEGWAHRLKACGYATDKQYAPKLIKIIEDYHLDELAKGKPVGTRKPETESKSSSSKGTKPTKATVVHATEPIATFHHDPEPPYVEPLTAKQERDNFFIEHTKKKCNGVSYVIAREGDTYANVAFRLNMKERDLREHNDALGRNMEPGDRVYLSAKKKKGFNTYVWTHPGQSLWVLCQDECIRMKTVQELNGLDPSIRTFTIRQKIYLKKVKDDDVR